MNVIEVTYEQAKVDIGEFFDASVERFPMFVAFCIWGGFDGLGAVVEGWREFLENGVSESLGVVLLGRDTVLID